jgi:ferredoxin
VYDPGILEDDRVIMSLIYSRRLADGSYKPPLLQRLLMPATSGNTINGRGETQTRRPSPIYHHENSAYPHRHLERWFRFRYLLIPAYWKLFKKGMHYAKASLHPVAAERQQDRPENWTLRVTDVARRAGVDLVGIARLDPEWVFDGYEVPNHPWIIMLGAAMDHSVMMDTATSGKSTPAGTHVVKTYIRLAEIAHEVGNWIHGQGWHAIPTRGGMAGPINQIPAAIEAGFGELGKHGSMINRELGSMFRLGYVITDMPLMPGPGPDSLDVDEVCNGCQVCRNECPPDAIYDEKQLVRGARKWYVDFDKCIPYFNDSEGCGICIAVCPWSRSGIADNLLAKLARRRARSRDETNNGRARDEPDAKS